ncbi:MAG TPA: hypothetical protein VKU82_11395 [Planctomycetaceae bacterium]|nr:hypothetical protein [Planctomycetaceae bacterium]
MFFRFSSALVLVVLVSLAGTALEKRNLELKRIVSRQQYRLEILLERHGANRVLAQQLGAPSRLIDELDAEPATAEKPATLQKADRPAAKKRAAGRAR